MVPPAGNVLEKLKGIKADLVRGEEGWQVWDLPRLVNALKKWKDIHSVDNMNQDHFNSKSPPKRNGTKSDFYHAKDGERKKRVCVYCEDPIILQKIVVKFQLFRPERNYSRKENYVSTAQA